MIYAKHSKLHRMLFNFYIDKKLKSYFNHFYLTEASIKPLDNKSILVLPNHFSWWDGFLVDFIKRKFFPEYKIFMMVLESTLNRFWFFKYLGTYSINPTKPKEVIESFRYTEKILSEKGNFVVIFPQGNLEPYSIDKIKFKEGLNILLNNSGINYYIQILALKIQFENEMKPNVYCNFYELKNNYDYLNNLEKLKEDFISNLKILEGKSLNRIIHSQIF